MPVLCLFLPCAQSSLEWWAQGPEEEWSAAEGAHVPVPPAPGAAELQPEPPALQRQVPHGHLCQGFLCWVSTRSELYLHMYVLLSTATTMMMIIIMSYISQTKGNFTYSRSNKENREHVPKKEKGGAEL